MSALLNPGLMVAALGAAFLFASSASAHQPLCICKIGLTP